MRLTKAGDELLNVLKSSIKTIADVITENITSKEKETLFNIVAKIVKAREENYPARL